MEYIYEQLPIRNLRSILRRAGGKIAESVSIGRDSNRNADRYWTNLILNIFNIKYYKYLIITIKLVVLEQ